MELEYNIEAYKQELRKLVEAKRTRPGKRKRDDFQEIIEEEKTGAETNMPRRSTRLKSIPTKANKANEAVKSNEPNKANEANKDSPIKEEKTTKKVKTEKESKKKNQVKSTKDKKTRNKSKSKK